MGKLTHLARIIRCQRNSAADVLCILQADQACNRVMHVLGADGGKNILEGEGAIRFVGNRTGLYPSQCRHTPRFIQIDMGPVSNDHFIPALAVYEQGQQVPHRPRRDKDRRFLAHHPCSQVLQPVDCGIIAVDIIPHFRFGHGLAHLRCGLGNGIRTKIDVLHVRLLLQPPEGWNALRKILHRNQARCIDIDDNEGRHAKFFQKKK